KPAGADDAYWHKLDISDVSGLERILEITAPHVVVSSLIGDFKRQMDIHRYLAAYLKKTGGRIIFVSTANVFDGDVRGRHGEGDKTYPISNYGKFKQACEALLQGALGEKCLVVRLPKIMDKKTAASFLKQAETGEPPVYKNLYMSFNTAQNVADALAYCVGTEKAGVLHLTSVDAMSISRCMDILLARAGKARGYTPQRLTVESFCGLLGCDEPKLLRHNGDGAFCMDLICTDPDITDKFAISCREALQV
ncbi:MAG: sugar nucleotide-binding protein, partial [Defluviitaleaceae bacterium]|nr:sugar nucleotide-binding protein [Defluviitaleaceae bacterium]